jgi:2-dehydropantoate 2-reductase
MKMLVVGAGAIGGYFGGRLLEAGRDVTFLVRARRASQLATHGLTIRSPAGDYHAPQPATVSADTLRERYDLVLLSCKAYDLEAAIEAVAPAVGPSTVVLPLLNGMRHLDVLERRFGAATVFGGQCVISAMVDDLGRIVHLNQIHALSFGERDGSRSARATRLAAILGGARFDAHLSDAIVQEMWEKWVFIATLAGITCLMRASIGDIVAAGGTDATTRLLDECSRIAAAEGHAPRDASLRRNAAMLTAANSTLSASMLRDVERGSDTEAEHIVGDLLRRGGSAGASPELLRIAYLHLAAYEARRRRLAAA